MTWAQRRSKGLLPARCGPCIDLCPDSVDLLLERVQVQMPVSALDHLETRVADHLGDGPRRQAPHKPQGDRRVPDVVKPSMPTRSAAGWWIRLRRFAWPICPPRSPVDTVGLGVEAVSEPGVEVVRDLDRGANGKRGPTRTRSSRGSGSRIHRPSHGHSFGARSRIANRTDPGLST